MKLKLTFEQVEEIRKRHAAGGISINKLAKSYGIDHAYCSTLIAGENRQIKDARRPILGGRPSNPNEYLRSANGTTWRRRGTNRRYIKQISFAVICQMRNEHSMNGRTAGEIAVRFSVALSYVKRILKMEVRKTS